MTSLHRAPDEETGEVHIGVTPVVPCGSVYPPDTKPSAWGSPYVRYLAEIPQ